MVHGLRLARNAGCCSRSENGWARSAPPISQGLKSLLSRPGGNRYRQQVHQAELEAANRGRGRRHEHNRLIINGILQWFRCGKPLLDVPVKYGNWNTIYRQFRRWKISRILGGRGCGVMIRAANGTRCPGITIWRNASRPISGMTWRRIARPPVPDDHARPPAAEHLPCPSPANQMVRPRCARRHRDRDRQTFAPRDGNYRAPQERRHARTRRSDGQSYFGLHEAALLSALGLSDAERGQAGHDLTRRYVDRAQAIEVILLHLLRRCATCWTEDVLPLE